MKVTFTVKSYDFIKNRIQNDEELAVIGKKHGDMISRVF